MIRPKTLLLAVVVASVAVPAVAQRSVAGVEDDEDEEEEDGDKKPAEQPADAKDPKKDDKKKKDEKKKDEKKKDAEAKKEPAKKDEAKKDEAKPAKKATPDDVLEETDDEKKKRKAEDDARAKAEEAAAAAEKKKAEEKAKLAEEKKAAEEKRRVENREQRLASARRVRALVREEGDVKIQIEVQPGAVVKGGLVEVRFEIGRKLDVADPKFGTREPLKNLQLTATVSEPTGKKGASRVYAVHSLGAPGQYGFHLTPAKDGVLNVQVTGEVRSGDGGRSIDITFPLHVGVWPPPDFDDEDKKLVARGS